MSPRLTDRQTAVLAAVERLGSANVFDLVEAFPRLRQSELMQTADRLVQRGRLHVEGDPTRRYLGGVRYFPAGSESSLPPELASLHAYVSQTLRLESWIAEARVGVAVPVAELERHLLDRSWCAIDLVGLDGGSLGTLDLLQQHLRATGTSDRLRLEVAEPHERWLGQEACLTLFFSIDREAAAAR